MKCTDQNCYLYVDRLQGIIEVQFQAHDIFSLFQIHYHWEQNSFLVYLSIEATVTQSKKKRTYVGNVLTEMEELAYSEN